MMRGEEKEEQTRLLGDTAVKRESERKVNGKEGVNSDTEIRRLEGVT